MENESTRASDDDRDTVIRQLSAQTAAGRLAQAEFEERMGAALRARTWGDLAALVADLPVDTPSPADRPRNGAIAPPRQPRFPTDRRRLSCLLLGMVGLSVAAIGSPVPVVAGLIAVVALCALATVCRCWSAHPRGNR